MTLPIDSDRIERVLADGGRMRPEDAAAAIEKARRAGRLELEEIAAIAAHAATEEERLFAAAREVRESVYGRRMILFAPLYWSSRCVNACLYCGFRNDNPSAARKVLGVEEVVKEARVLASRGYRRVLLESGEDPATNTIERACEIMRGLYALKDDAGRQCIDRVNVNIAATTTENYRKLAEAGVGTYNLFQETYHRPTYERVHARGPKHDYVRQITAHDRAYEAGIGDVGLGVLWGLHDWHYELLALVEHARRLEAAYGIGPHTLSMPRIKAAGGVRFDPPHPVSDGELLRIIALLRLAVPYAGIVISTRESAELRRRSFAVGVSQTSAGSSTEVGGYSSSESDGGGQFRLGDHRSLDYVVRELLMDGFIPAFCTACEQRGRSGATFARFAKTGLIGQLCAVNSLLALRQYVVDGRKLGFISEETAAMAEELIRKETGGVQPFVRAEIEASLARISGGALAKDEYV